MTAEIYRNQLIQKGLTDTRATAITEALSDLHKAFAACDLTNRKIVRNLFQDKTMNEIVTSFAQTEDLNQEIFEVRTNA